MGKVHQLLVGLILFAVPVYTIISSIRVAYHVSSGIFFNADRLALHFLRLLIGLMQDADVLFGGHVPTTIYV
jgi:hypothetical protein